VDGDGCFIARESYGTARAVHAPPLVAVWILPTFMTVMVLLVVVFVCVYFLIISVFHSVPL
jgi:hypothetical protein